MAEYLTYLKIEENEEIRSCRMYVQFLSNGQCKIRLDGHNFSEEAVESSYSRSLEALLRELPSGSTLHLNNKIVINKNGFCHVMEISEKVKLSFVPYENDDLIEFILGCTFENQGLIAACFDDFGIAFSNLVKQIGLPVETCAYCHNGDFKSDGGEDLRHGWYCFRDVENANMQLPWVERLKMFSKATPNLSAFFWCPGFQYQNKELA